VNPFGIIYKATGPSGKVYVGQTTYSLKKRKSEHKFMSLKKDRRTAFQQALLDEGFDNFTWEQIDTAETREDLDQKEKHWITYYDSMNPDRGYNLAPGGLAWSPSEKTRRKIGEANRGNKYNLGKHHSEETRKKISEAKKGKRPYVMTEEICRKISEARRGGLVWNKGKHHTEETRRRMSEAHKGKKYCLGRHLSEEHRRHISEANKGRVVSPETRCKISEAKKARFSSKTRGA
jgi:group I intron endonuclease